MKKITLLILMLLCMTGAKATVEYVAYQPDAPVVVSWQAGGNQPSYAGSYFTVSSGDVIKVHVTNVSSSNYQPKIVWKGTDGNGWTALDCVTTTDGVFTYTITTDEIATSIDTYGIALSGEGYSMLDITVETSLISSSSQTFFTDQSYDQGQWTWNNRILLYRWKYNFAQLKSGDILTIGYTTYSTVGSNDVHGQLSVTDGTTAIGYTGYNETPSTPSTLEITLTDDMITQLYAGETYITGENVYVNSMTATSSNHITTKTYTNSETVFGTSWSESIEMKNVITDYSNVSAGDVLALEYTTDASNSGTIQLQYGWSEYANYSGITANTSGTLYIPITSDLLTKLDEDNIQIKGEHVTIPANGISIIHFISITKPGYRPVYIPASGYATFYGESTCALPDGITNAYYVSETTESSAKLSSISNIPANQGVILKGTAGIYQLYTTTDEAASVSGNKLVGSVSRTPITDTETIYVLINNDGTPEFRTVTANTYLDAYKCYLSTATAAHALSIIFDDGSETTGINTVQSSEFRDQSYYTLDGRKLNGKPSKAGLYIVNGKKVIIK